MRAAMPALAVCSAMLAAGCNDRQSTFETFGAEADGIRTLTFALVAGAVVIAAAVGALAFHATRAPEGELSHAGGMRLILWLGGIGPAVILGALLVYALPAMRPRAVAPGDLRIRSVGEQFWFRVRYEPPGQVPIESANEVRVPVGRTVLFELEGGDVIHSFWIPGLAGKIDMIPGRVNRLPVRATRAGRFRGQCTEFCGTSHALMAFDVVAMEPGAFDRWLAGQRRPASSPGGPGQALFGGYGCGACHAIRGEGHAGEIGPDLTHFGARPTFAAGIRRQEEAALAQWIRRPDTIKPGVRMPAFPGMPPRDAVLIARYLQGLQ